MAKNAELTLVLLRFEQELTKALSELEQKPEHLCVLKFSRDNWVRLLNLKVWSQKYCLSLQEILKVLLKGKFGKIRKTHRYATLGIVPAVLTGPSSQQTIEQYVKTQYPQQENFDSYREMQKRKILPVVCTGKPLTTKNWVKEYGKHIEYKRQLIETGNKEFRRPWRENPWLSNRSLLTQISKTT
jgi:hypothetical protein